MSKIEQLLEFLKENPDDTFYRYALALEYVKVKELTLAKNIFEKLIIEEPNYLATYYQYGNLLADMGHNELAEEIFKKGIAIASMQNNHKTRQELEQAMFLLD
jgi:tetratricopeptide (TPR) repeat protein